MKITSENFLRFSLLLPYVFGITLICLVQIFDPTFDNNMDLAFLELIYQIAFVPIALVSIFYLIGAIYWLIPYSFLAIVLWKWSIKKEKKQIYKVFMKAPLFLAVLIIIYSTSLSVFNIFPDFFSIEDILAMSLLTISSSIFLGYGFISLTAWVYYYLKRRGYITDKELQFSGENN